VSLLHADDEDVKVMWYVVPTGTPGYSDMKHDAALGKVDGAYVREDGKLVRITCWRKQKMRGRILSIGWRCTFENLIRHKIPGITRESLAAKFGVDMLKCPAGTPEELASALMEDR
jgi:hypothetical protein